MRRSTHKQYLIFSCGLGTERRPIPLSYIVGDGTLRNLVEQAAAANPKILYTGRQPTATVVQWMRASDALVLPSLFEPWGLVVNVAMCCGLPIIATDRVGAVDDLVFDGLNGIIVPVGDGAALAGSVSV